jgi:subtilisin family serine protease
VIKRLRPRENALTKKKGPKIVGIIIILIIVIAANFWMIPVAWAKSADNNSSASRVSSLLSLHLKIKEGRSSHIAGNIEQFTGESFQANGETNSSNFERVFLHFAEPPTDDQIHELNSLGVRVYPDSWIPPVNNFKTGFVLADMPVDKLDSLIGKSYIVTMDTAEQRLSSQNDLAREAMNVGDVWMEGYDGTGVKVAVLDSGLDTSNPDFPTPVAAIDYSAFPSKDSTVDNNVTGHGTHVAGSLLGRGAHSAAYKGVAPGADLIFIKIADDTTGSASSDAVAYALRDAVDVYHAKIINLSYGGWSQYHDGSDQVCQAVDYATSQGAAVFVAAGNSASYGWHYSGMIAANRTSAYIPITVAEGATSYLAANLVWYDSPGTHNNLSLQYYDPAHNLIDSPTTGGQSESARGTESNVYQLTSPVSSGTYYLKVKNSSSHSQMFHIYYMGGSSSITFSDPDSNYTIASPAESDSAMAVGAYVSRSSWTNYQGSIYFFPDQTVGQIADYSSCGPRVDDGAPAKPDFVSPGSAVISVRDPIYTPGNTAFDPGIIDDDGQNQNGSGPANYIVNGGTSMASPMAAGVAALLLQKNPALTPVLIKSELEATAIDKGTAGLDNIYGWGLINAKAASGYPVLVTNDVSMISASGATLNATLSQIEDAGSVNVGFDYGTTTAYGSFAAGNPATLTAPGTFSAVITGLSPNTTYHYRAKAVGDKITYGDDVAFTSDSWYLAFTAGSQTLAAGEVSDNITIQTQYPEGEPDNVTGNMTIHLTSTSGSGRFDTGASGAFDGTVTSVTIPAGSSQASFYYEDTKAGTPTITASGSGLISQTQSEVINAGPFSGIGFGTQPQTDIIAGRTSGIITVQAQDAYGNQTQAISTITANLSSSSKTGRFDNLTNGPFDGSISSVIIFEDNVTSGFYYRDNLTGTPVITASAEGYPLVTQRETVIAAEASVLSVSGASSIAVNSSGRYTVTAKDVYGNTAAGYTGTVHLTSSDNATVLPANYSFLSADKGVHVFTVKFKTLGTQSLTATDTVTSSITGTKGNITVQKAGGGGGGGGGGSSNKITTVLTTGLNATSVLQVDMSGIVQNTTHLGYDNGSVDLGINKSTVLLTAVGGIPSKLTIAKLEAPPDPPSRQMFIEAYEFGPEGAKFNPAISLTFKYNSQNIAAGSALSIAGWDGARWVILESQVDPAAGTVTARISHFSKYALLAEIPPAPAKFTLSDLEISAAVVNPDQAVTIRTEAANIGGSRGQYMVVLKINSVEIESRQIELTDNATQMVVFQIKRSDPGEYAVDINGKTGKFTIVVPVSPAPEKTPLPTLPGMTLTPLDSVTPIPAATSTTAPVASTAAPETKTGTPVSPFWIGAGVIVIAGLSTLAIVTNRKKKSSRS